MPRKDVYAKYRTTCLEWRREQIKRQRALLDSLKAGPCMDCGNTFPPECMDFDHARGEKEFSVNTQTIGRALSRIMAELEKCDLVCSNCHRTRTRRRMLEAEDA